MRNNRHHNWLRYWYKLGASITITDRGFPAPPRTDSSQGYNPNPELVPFAAIADVPCLVLLGDSGMGKTRALQAEYDRLANTTDGITDKPLWKDLAVYNTDVGLMQGVSRDRVFREWEQGTHTLHLYLDSLDESRAHIRTVLRLLPEWLSGYAVNRIRLRIACRPAEWSAELERQLRQVWGEDNVGVYVLAPLFRRDVETAAHDYGIDPAAFLAEIDEREVSAFAMRPVTLKMLISIYRMGQQLPEQQAELYRQGCLQLCQEEDRERAQRVRRILQTKQRFAVAARIAYVTMFGGRYAIWKGTNLDEGFDEASDITQYHLAGRWERTDDGSFSVQEQHIEETLGTGLFTRLGDMRVGWAHRSYSEYLAAWYLKEHSASVSQLMELLTNPQDPTRKVIPQLHDVATRLADLVPGVFQEIMRADPEVLLRSDIASAENSNRAALVSALLEAFDRGDIPSSHHGYTYYHKLQHPGLAGQLRPYITGEQHSYDARSEAIDIAERCQLSELENELVQVALAEAEHEGLRIEAARTLIRIGSSHAKAQLRPLAMGEAGPDPYDQLKGLALEACWPDHIRAAELFRTLHAPKQPGLFGGYYLGFLHDELAGHLPVEDIPIALKWLQALSPEWQRHRRRGFTLMDLDLMLNGIMQRAMEQIENSRIRGLIARIVLKKVQSYEFEEELRAIVLADEAHRELLLRTLLPLLHETYACRSLRNWGRSRRHHRIKGRSQTTRRKAARDVWHLVSYGIVRPTDSAYLVEAFKSAKASGFRRLLADILSALVRSGDHSKLAEIYDLARPSTGIGSPALSRAFAWLLQPVVLASTQAQQAREYYQSSLNREQRRGIVDGGIIDPPPAELVRNELQLFEGGDIDAWWRLNTNLALKPDSLYYNELESDITRLPGWEVADGETRSRIVQAARRYVIEGNPYNVEWLGLDSAPMLLPALAGYRALQLLLQEDPGFVDTIPAAAWAQWAAIILDYPGSSGSDEVDTKRTLVCLAYGKAPEAVLEAFLILARQENRQHGHIYVVSKLAACWDDRIADAVLELAGSAETTPSSLSGLLHELLSHEHKRAEAVALAESLIPYPPPVDGEDLEKALFAEVQLLQYAADLGWERIWRSIQADDTYGKRLMQRVAAILHRSDTAATRLNAGQLRDLYLWLVRKYPPSTEDFKSGVVTTEQHIAHLRDDTLGWLARKGSQEAVQALEYIRDQLPQMEIVRRSLHRAQEIFRKDTWQPLTPDQLLELALEPDARVVLTERHLQQVVMESLQRMNEDLQGETPTAIRLWNECVWHPRSGGCSTCGHEGSRFTPKDEERLSDEVKRHLEQDLKRRSIIINREVVIRRSDRTDLYITTFTEELGERRDQITVIVEVKGCWHDEVKTAMQTQLVDRYLRDHACRHGIYLVGWFLCSQWSEEGRKTTCRRAASSMEELERILKGQATNLSVDRLRIEAFVLNVTLRPPQKAKSE